MKYIQFIFFLPIFFASCNNKAEKEVADTINAVYSKPNVYDQLGADTTLLSKQLSGLIAKAKEVEALDLQRMRSTEYPPLAQCSVGYSAAFLCLHRFYSRACYCALGNPTQFCIWGGFLPPRFIKVKGYKIHSVQ